MEETAVKLQERPPWERPPWESKENKLVEETAVKLQETEKRLQNETKEADKYHARCEELKEEKTTKGRSAKGKEEGLEIIIFVESNSHS